MKVELIRIPLKIRVLFRNEGYSFFDLPDELLFLQGTNPILSFHLLCMFNFQLEFGFVSIKVCCGFRKHWYIKGLYSQFGIKVASFKINLRKRRR